MIIFGIVRPENLPEHGGSYTVYTVTDEPFFKTKEAAQEHLLKKPHPRLYDIMQFELKDL